MNEIATLHAVVEAVKSRNQVAPAAKEGKNGGLPPVWKCVAIAMLKLTGKNKSGEGWRKVWRTSVPSGPAPDVSAAVAEAMGGAPAPGPIADESGLDMGPEEPAEPKAKPLSPNQRRKVMLTSDPSDELLAVVADADERIEQAEAKARTFERLYKQAKARSAFVRTAIDALRDTVTALEPLPWDKDTIPAIHLTKEQEAVLILSDIHIGDEIKTDTMGAINEYNFDIFKEKSKRLFAGVKESLEMLREFGPCSRFNIFGLGDWVTGTNIFPGQAHHVEFGAMKQALRGADEMAVLYQEILHLPGIEVINAEHIPGNHGRPGRKGNDPFEDNWDLVLYEFHRLRLQAEKRINYRWHESWWMKPNIMGWEFLCAHGDEVKGWNGVPNYGFRRWASKWREMLDTIGQRYDYGVIGHHHIEVEEKNLVISGAWPGASFFSAKELQAAGPATQMLYSVTEEHGITWRRRLPLDPARHPNWSNQQTA
jgi:hypothetical protein